MIFIQARGFGVLTLHLFACSAKQERLLSCFALASLTNKHIMSVQKIKQFKKVLGIENEIVGVEFSNKPPADCRHFRDTACTALARAIFEKSCVVFDANVSPQLCQGANYFLKLSTVKMDEVHDTYINKEKVFKDKKTCNLFLKKLPKFPDSLKNKFISIKIFHPKDKALLVVLLATPAQASRIFGLLNRKQYKTVEIHPNQPACLSFFAPLVVKGPHCNFIDYYDRYYQGAIGKKRIWPEDKMLISLRRQDFQEILNNLDKSAQGSFSPDLLPQQVDNFE